MNEYIPYLIAVVGAVASWYCYRCGHDDGRAEGYDEGRTKGLLEGRDITPNISGGPREPA